MNHPAAASPASRDLRKAPRSVGPAVVIGSALEWFDFYLFASMAALVFGQVFFPGNGSMAGTFASIATFAVGFLARPLGGLVFGLLGDKIGRKAVMSGTFVLMGLASTMIGLIPSYDTIGVMAPILLVSMRILQGLGAGAEFASAIAVSYEHAGAKTRGRMGAWPALGTNLGLLASSLTVALLTSLDKEFLYSWGWRIPFLASFALVVVGFWVRRRMPETPEFEQIAKEAQQRKNSRTLRDLFGYDWRGMLVVAGLTVGYLGASYIFKTFSLTYLVEFAGVAANIGAFGISLASVAAIIMVPIAGRLCDKIGAARVLYGGAMGVAAMAFPFFWLLDTGSSLLIWTALILATGVFIPAMLAASGSFFARQFPTEVRATGLATSREVGGIAGGLAPLSALALVAASPSNSTMGVSLFLIAGAGAIIVATRCDQMTRIKARNRSTGATDLDEPRVMVSGGHR